MSSSKKRGSVSGDAFALLMGSTSKKKPPQRKHSSMGGGTRFVPCPAGCGQSLLEKDVNRHLDRCLVISGGEEEEDSDARVRRVTQSEQQPSLLVNSGSCIVVSQSTPNAEDVSQKTREGRVLCPVCSKSFRKAFLNLHLDQCTQKEHQQPMSQEEQQVGCPQNEVPAANKSKEPKSHDRNDKVNDSCDSMEITDESGSVATHLDWSTDTRLEPCDDNNDRTPDLLDKRQEIKVQNEETKETTSATEATALQPKPTSTSKSAKPNVFATMMKQSKTAFANAKTPTNSGTSATVRQTFHLLNLQDGSVALVLRNTPPPPPELEWNCCWSANVIVKDKLARNSSVAENNHPPLAFDMTLSSSVPSHGTNSTDQPVRWVRHHSRLSVPVLKSILQKAVRRRRPLPAVRVAMELADKALGELLRRLPIIVLEDSTLHPDLDFLVWIMMAHSKDFAPPPRLLVRVFQIVFEVAHCQWSDHLRSDSQVVPTTTTAAADPVTTLTSLYYDKTNRSDTDSRCHIVESSLLWSMLVRAEYGGMRGDVQMLHQFAHLWRHRFFPSASTSEQSTTVPTAVASRISTNTSKNDNDAEAPSCHWSDVPTRIHQRAKEQSVQRVTALCSSGIERLTMEDVCVEGVDFHCSRVLDELLADAELCGMCLDLLILANGNDTVPRSAEGRRSYLERIWKDCMWKYSSGVNRRRPLVVVSSSSLSESQLSNDDDGEQYSELWNDLVAPKALAYQRNYVQQRLAPY